MAIYKLVPRKHITMATYINGLKGLGNDSEAVVYFIGLLPIWLRGKVLRLGEGEKGMIDIEKEAR